MKIIKGILYAPEEYWDMEDIDKNRICNGCGPKGTFDFVPEHIWGLRIGECCRIHDMCYHIAEPTIEAKNEADRIFLNNMLRLIDMNTEKYLINISFFRIKNPLLWLRRRAAYIYYEGVKRFGGPAFWAGKNKSENLKGIYSLCN